MSEDDEIRDALSNALRGRWVFRGDAKADDLADILLPYVVGNMRRYAALHLRDAADEIRARFGWAGGYGKELRARADALDPDGRPSPVPTGDGDNERGRG